MYRIAEHSGLESLTEATTLLQRARNEHPIEGLWEAADMQWWWRSARTTDPQPMPFWYDDRGPVATARLTQWSSALWLDPVVLPSVKDALLQEVVERGLALADGQGLEMLVDDEDQQLRGLLAASGFEGEGGDVTGWMDAVAAPDVSPLADGYRLTSRAENASSPHHFTRRGGPDAETRLRQTSLYRADLDLFIVDDTDEAVAYGLFWPDPVTGVGLVEPMRTEDPHQGKGLARHIITAGIRKLVAEGSRRIKINWEGDNEPAARLYTSVGFEPSMTCSLWRPGAE